jgi:hypothetical protein
LSSVHSLDHDRFKRETWDLSYCHFFCSNLKLLSRNRGNTPFYQFSQLLTNISSQKSYIRSWALLRNNGALNE